MITLDQLIPLLFLAMALLMIVAVNIGAWADNAPGLPFYKWMARIIAATALVAAILATIASVPRILQENEVIRHVQDD